MAALAARFLRRRARSGCIGSSANETCTKLYNYDSLYVFVQIRILVRFRTNHKTCTFLCKVLACGYGVTHACRAHRRCSGIALAAKHKGTFERSFDRRIPPAFAQTVDPAALLRHGRGRIPDRHGPASIAPGIAARSPSGVAATQPADWHRPWRHHRPAPPAGEPPGWRGLPQRAASD